MWGLTHSPCGLPTSSATFAEAQLNITVLNVNDPPEFTADPRSPERDATALSVYTGTLATSAGDPDVDDLLVFEKTSGPAWLVVNPDGSLSGTPAESDEGPNEFVVSVTDALNAVDSATLQITVLPPPIVDVVASDATASETGLETGAFTITRSGSTTGDLIVNFTLTGTALNGVDYVTYLQQHGHPGWRRQCHPHHHTGHRRIHRRHRKCETGPGGRALRNR